MEFIRFLRTATIALFFFPAITVWAGDRNPTQERADQFLSLVNASYQALYRVNSEAQWDALTDVSPVHDAASVAAGKAYAAFNGNLALLGADGLHPNANGYAVIADAFLDTIKGTLETSTPLVPSFAPMLRHR